ncbi:MAG: TonB-dependent receptor [Ferruginibacter sp.]
MNKTFLFIFLIISSLTSYTQSTVNIQGKITDSKNKPVEGATVHLLNTSIFSVTNVEGNFSMQNVYTGKYTAAISAVGYTSVNENISVAKSDDRSLSFQLKEDIRQLDAVVVSGEKKETDIQSVPFSITALSEKNIKDYRLWRAEELTAIIPNLYSGGPGDGRNVTSVRGIVSTSYDPAVTTTIDGVNQFTLDTYIPQLFDVASIEVLRGPQGTLYGRNAMGGVINIITKQPTNKTDAFAEINVGNYGAQRYTTGVRTPLIKNKLFIGIAGLYDGFNGFYKNEYNNTNFDRQHSIGGNYYLKYLINSKWNATLNAKHLAALNHGPFSLASSKDDAFSNPFKVNQNATSEMNDKTFNSSLSVNYTGQKFNFTSQSAYQSNRRFYEVPLDGDFSPIDGITIVNNYGGEWNKVKVLTQEFKFTSPASINSKWQWLTGAYLFYQKSPNKQGTHFGKDAQLVGSPDIDYTIINTSTVKNAGGALFGQATYSISDKVDIKAGLRYDYQHSTENVLGEYQPDASPTPVFQTQPDTSGTASYSAFSPMVSIAYHVEKNSNLYATYSRGYRTGGLTQLSPDPSQPPLYAYKPEYSNNFEIGSKNLLFNNQLRFNVSVFYSIITNAQVPTLVLPQAITVTKNAGKLSSKGFDAELNATILKGLEVVYNVGYTDAVYKSLKIPQNGQAADLNGNHQVYTPDLTSMMALQYSIPLNQSQSLKLLAGGEWFYLGRQYFDLANNIRQSPYNLLNTRFGIAAKHFQIMFWGRNLTNRKYVAYAYDFGATHLGNPKTYGITLRTDL